MATLVKATASPKGPRHELAYYGTYDDGSVRFIRTSWRVYKFVSPTRNYAGRHNFAAARKAGWVEIEHTHEWTGEHPNGKWALKAVR